MEKIMLIVCLFLISLKPSYQFDETSQEVSNATSGNCQNMNGVWTHWTSWSNCGCKSNSSTAYRMCYSQRRIVQLEKVEKFCYKQCQTSESSCSSWISTVSCCGDIIGGIAVNQRKCNRGNEDFLQLRYCEDVYFAIHFLKDTTTDLPTIENVKFPTTDGISICFWYRTDKYYSGYNEVVSFVSPDTETDNDLAVSFHDKLVILLMNRKAYPTVLKNFPIRTWNHLCLTWNSLGRWNTYVNGEKNATGKADEGMVGSFAGRNGYILLGQDTDIDGTTKKDAINDASQTFSGEITQLYIYHSKLTDEQVFSVYKHSPIKKNLLTGWWQFKGKSKGSNIIETKYPFSKP